jgi:DNA repair photolyase
MILNVSGRTDIVAFYSRWFLNRYKEGFVDVRNPFYPKLISRIYFKDVDAIVFCTKNPLPILNDLKKFEKPILFQVTLTPYKKDIEPHVPSKGLIIEGIKKISMMIGIENVFVRYDPIFISHTYTVSYHKKAFEHMCCLLEGSIKAIIVSFLDDYKNVRKNKAILDSMEMTEKMYEEIGRSFSESARRHGMTVQTCFEDRNLVEYGFIKEDCLSQKLAFRVTGKTYKPWKARKEKKCHCVEMVDIGVYNSCKHFCKYCYANFDEKRVEENFKHHEENASLLIGHIEKEDVIKIRTK